MHSIVQKNHLSYICADVYMRDSIRIHYFLQSPWLIYYYVSPLTFREALYYRWQYRRESPGSSQ